MACTSGGDNMDLPQGVTVTDATPMATTSSSDDYYDAINPKGRRRKASRQSRRPEDLLLTQHRRDDLDANAYDLYRNLVTLRWMVRQTLNFVCEMDVQYKTDDQGLNQALRERMHFACEPDQIHYVGRMDWDDIRRNQESGKLTTGDAYIVPLQEMTLQPVEGTYCRNPMNMANGGRWCNGAKLDRRDRVTHWNFREESLTGVLPGQKTDREVSARNVWQHIQFDANRQNQVRGVGEIISALNGLRDVGEGFDLNLAKLKVEALLGVHIKRRMGENDELGMPVSNEGADADNDETTDDDLHLDFGGGPVVIDREDIEDVKLLMSGSPPQATQDFLKLCLMVGLMALDLPYNFLDSGHSNFFGNQAALLLYQKSCVFRRKAQHRLHKRMTNWRHMQWFLPVSAGGTGEFALKKSQSLSDIKYLWIPQGIPWWRPGEQLKADMHAVALGWKTNQDVCDERGLGLYENNLRQLQQESVMRAKYGFELNQNPQKLDVSLQPVGGGTATQGGAT